MGWYLYLVTLFQRHGVDPGKLWGGVLPWRSGRGRVGPWTGDFHCENSVFFTSLVQSLQSLIIHASESHAAGCELPPESSQRRFCPKNEAGQAVVGCWRSCTGNPLGSLQVEAWLGRLRWREAFPFQKFIVRFCTPASSSIVQLQKR